MKGREVKDLLYEQFARIGKAMASPKRIEIIELLSQGERPVESIAEATGMTVGNTSAHLKALRQAGLVSSRREGTTIFYTIADESVSGFLGAIRDLARARLGEVRQVVTDWFDARDELEPVSRKELRARLKDGEVVVIDVRPRQEYEAGHIPGAISIPLDRLPQEASTLPKGREVIAYCRGPYCVLAPEALTILRSKGLIARRLQDGFPEWKRSGLPVEVGLPGSSRSA